MALKKFDLQGNKVGKVLLKVKHLNRTKLKARCKSQTNALLMFKMGSYYYIITNKPKFIVFTLIY